MSELRVTKEDPTPEPTDAPRRDADRARLVDTAVVALCGFVVLACAAIVVTLDYGRDQAIYAVVAREIVRGGMPYRDAFDFKPPGIFVVYAIARALFGASMRGVRILEALSMLVTAYGLVSLSRIHFGRTRPGWIAAALAAQVHAQLDFWHTGQPESFGGMLTIMGLVLSTRAHAKTRAGDRLGAIVAWVAAGALFGAAGLMKPPLAGAGAVVALLSALASWKPRLEDPDAVNGTLRARLVSASTTLGATALGGVLPFLLVLAWFSAKGALHDMHEVLLVFTPYYTKLSWENASVVGMTYYGFEEWLMTYSGALLFGIFALVATRPTRREGPLVAVVSALVLLHIAGVVMQGKFFPYHWGATFPLTALLAALGIDKAFRWARGTSVAATVVMSVAFLGAALSRAPVPNLGPTFLLRAAERFSLFVTGPMDVARKDALASVAGVEAGENRAVADWVREHTRPGDPIFVWGFECVIYDIADRPLSSRYIYDVPQRATWSKEPMQQALMIELAAKPPVVIVVEHGDMIPMVTGDNLDSAQSLAEFPALRNLIEEDYVYAKRVGDFDVYTRADLEH